MSARLAPLLALSTGLALTSSASSPLPAVVDPPALQLSWSWSIAGGNIGSHGFGLGDVDADGRDEILAAARSPGYDLYWYQLGLHDGLEMEWSSLPVADGVEDLVVARRPGGEREILLASADQLVVYDAASKLPVRAFPAGVAGARRLAVADLDANGTLEVVVCGEQNLAILDFDTGATLAAAAGLGCSALAIGQTDADAQREIALTVPLHGTLLVDGQTLGIEWEDPTREASEVAFVDADGDGFDELVIGNVLPDSIRLVEPASGQVSWETSVLDLGGMAVADVWGDGDPEIVFADRRQSQPIRVLAAATGELLEEIAAETSHIDRLLVGQLDEDPAMEIAWATGAWDWDDGEVVVIDAATFAVEGRTAHLVGGFRSLSGCRIPLDAGPRLLTASRRSRQFELGSYLAFEPRLGRLEVLGSLPPEAQNDFNALELARAANVDADPQQEVCAALGYGSTGDGIICLDSQTGATEWYAILPDGSGIRALEFAELDGDSRPELLVASVGGSPSSIAVVYALEGENGWLKWRSPDLGAAIAGGDGYLRWGDVDGDGISRIVVGFRSGGVAVLSGADGTVEASSADLNLESLELADIDSDPAPDIVVGDFFGDLSRLDPRTGQIEATLFRTPYGIENIAIADFDRDGVQDFAIASPPHLVVHAGADPTSFWSAPYLGRGAGPSGGLAAADFDGDGSPELALGLSTGVALFEILSQPLFADGFESGDTSAWTEAVP